MSPWDKEGPAIGGQHRAGHRGRIFYGCEADKLLVGKGRKFLSANMQRKTLDNWVTVSQAVICLSPNQ